VTDLEQVVQAVESGLLSAVRIQGRPQQRMKLRERMARYHVPGFSIALIEHDEIAWAGSYGVLEAGGDEVVMSETLFQAASISKPVSAMAALHLVEAGVLDLDADVNDVLRSWQVPETEHTREHKVTLRGLLSHVAGLSVSGFRGYAAGADVPTVLQVLDGEPPANSDPVRVMQEPGEAYSYSGGGYMVMQQLLEDVTGRPFADLVQELVLDKLGMAHSTFAQSLSKANSTPAATAHQSNGEPVPGRWHIYPELATAGLWSTPTDLARFVIEVLRSEAGESNAVLSFEMTRQMLTPQPGSLIGLGLAIIEMDGWTRFEHPGWNEGYHSLLCGYTGTGQGVAWMTNGENGKLLGQEVMRGLARVYGWPGFEPQVQAVARPNPANARYEGRYWLPEEPDWGAAVFQEGDRLFWEDVPDGLSYELYPSSETVFFTLERPEGITFVEGADGSIEAVMVGEYMRLQRVD
jgi:CubicO group peptidase (beta-lactamase class C family)